MSRGSDMAICNTYANDTLNKMYAGTLYLALMTGDPTQDGLFTQEMAGDGYVRKPVTFTTASNRSTSNSSVVWWADLPDLGIRYIAVCTALSGGSMISYQSVGTNPIFVPEGQKFILGAGDLAFTLG